MNETLRLLTDFLKTPIYSNLTDGQPDVDVASAYNLAVIAALKAVQKLAIDFVKIPGDRAALDESIALMADLLRAGEHEGVCTNEDEPFPKLNPCYSHLDAFATRQRRAEEFLARHGVGR